MSKVGLTTKPLQTEVKISTKPLLKFYCAPSTGKESAEKQLLNLPSLKSLLSRFQMWALYENIGFLTECHLDALFNVNKIIELVDCRSEHLSKH